MKNHLAQLSIPLENRPGALHAAIKALSAASVNILGVSSEAVGSFGFVHIVSDAGAKAAKVLKRAGFDVFQTPIFNADLANRPGELARLTKALAEKGINITQIYGTTSGHVGRLLFTVNDAEKAKPIVAKFYKQGPMALDNE